MIQTTLIFLIASITIVFAQESSVPQGVQDAFKNKYPNMTAPSWDREDDNKYEATFNRDGKTYEAKFSANGEWLKTERDVNRSEVPQAVLTALANSEYAAWEQGDNFDEVETPAHAKLYKIEVERGDQEYNLYFTPEGELVNRERD
ncbi:PepSY-like domain-containing protein [Pontibacter diazotrophicus]|nr:PepSY-like domain-containing protein [Pontibacter diazotrophicus]